MLDFQGLTPPNYNNFLLKMKELVKIHFLVIYQGQETLSATTKVSYIISIR